MPLYSGKQKISALGFNSEMNKASSNTEPSRLSRPQDTPFEDGEFRKAFSFRSFLIGLAGLNFQSDGIRVTVLIVPILDYYNRDL